MIPSLVCTVLADDLNRIARLLVEEQQPAARQAFSASVREKLTVVAIAWLLLLGIAAAYRAAGIRWAFATKRWLTKLPVAKRQPRAR